MADLLQSDDRTEGPKEREPNSPIREKHSVGAISPKGKHKAIKASSSPKLTAKQERFAQLIANGKTQSDAYRMAYDVSPSTKDTTIHVQASELASHPKVVGRVASLKAALTDEDWQDMGKMRALALKTLANEAAGLSEDTKSSSRVAAAVAIGKITEVNLFTDHKVVEHRDDARLLDLKTKLEQRLSTLFNGPVPALSGQTQPIEAVEGRLLPKPKA